MASRLVDPAFESVRIPSIKGSALCGFLVWLEEQHGPERLAAAAAALPPALRDQIHAGEPALGLLVSRWYPVTLAHPVMDSITAGMSRAERQQLVHEATPEVVSRAIRGVYRVLFEAIASPSLYARHVQRAWRQLHDTGDRAITITEPGVADSTIRNWPGHHPMFCEIATETMVAVFRAMKCRDVTVSRVACVSDGDALCHTILRWTA